jgi:hypothetical protein
MKIVEVTLKGFDGGTDSTDDKIIWVYAESAEQVTLSTDSVAVYIEQVCTTDLLTAEDFSYEQLDDMGVDYYLPRDTGELVKSIKDNKGTQI